jgi:hypothetical protein
MAAGAAFAIVYAGAVARLETAPAPPTGLALDREAAAVTERVRRADELLHQARDIGRSYAIAVELRARHTLWAETESVLLLERMTRAADSLLDESARAALADSLRVLEAREALVPRRSVIDSGRVLLVDRLYGRDGRIDRAGLRLLQRTKGVPRPDARALLLEPLYFAPRLSRTEVRRTVDAIVDGRVMRARAAGELLVHRLRSDMVSSSR